jgi:hypothetical protein
MMSDPDVRAQHASFFAAAYGQIDWPDEFKSISTQGHVTIYAAVVVSGFPDRETMSQSLGKEAGLVLRDRNSFVVDHFLESNDVWLNLL